MPFTGTVKVGNSVALSPTGLLQENRESDRSGPDLEEGYSQSGIEAVDHRLARIAKGGLGSGVVLLMELESDSVSRLSSNAVGREGEKTGTADDNTMVRTSGGGGGRRRIHNDWSGGRYG